MVNFAVVYSKKDEAGKNIAEQLKNHFLPQVPIIEFTKDSIYLEEIDNDKRLKNTEFIIFASRHQSKADKPSLSLHAPGNWRNADFGGKPGKVCRTSSQALKFLFQKLNENAEKENSEYQVTLECTHHGPIIKTKPCLFIELGSSLNQWQDKKAASIIAKTISDFQNFELWKNENKGKIIPTFLIGGGHYSPAGNKVMLETNYAIGHIFPKYQLPITQSMILEALNKTEEQINEILIDWNGLGIYKKETVELLDKLRLKYKKVQDIV